MNINKDIGRLFIVAMVVIVVYLIGLTFMYFAFKDVVTVQENQLRSIYLANETSSNSFALTSNVRDYISSGKKKYKDAYMHILDVQTGAKARPANAHVAPGATVHMAKLFEEAEFTPEEEALLKKANQLSDNLAQLEISAMDKVENAKAGLESKAREEAMELLYGDQYDRTAASIQEPVDQFNQILTARLTKRNNEVHRWADTVGFSLVGLTLFSSILVIGAIIWLRKRVFGALGKIAEGLGVTGDSVSQTAQQLATNSREISEGANSQASSLEQTSAALTQMSTGTRQNAENADRTNDNTQEMIAAIAKGSDAVNNMTSAMGEISATSEEISRIIKTIEEIAFQTNLLALNAAVEAARAGESGKGFAVVADEVRNLAGRSAQAARDTSSLINRSVTNVRNGSTIANGLAEDFKVIDEKAHEVGQLIQSISLATNEQAKGMEQINGAVSEMDKLTQRNASNAKEMAEASDNLMDLSDDLTDMTLELTDFIKSKRREKKMRRRDAKGLSSASPASPAMVSAQVARNSHRGEAKLLPLSSSK